MIMIIIIIILYSLIIWLKEIQALTKDEFTWSKIQ